VRRAEFRAAALRSASDAHPNGLANGSGQVGRNYMRHDLSIVMALLKEPNRTVYQKTLAVSDFYFGADDWEFPLGLIQMCATSHGEQIRGEAVHGFLSWLPEMPFEKMAEHSIDFWLQSEDLPNPANRVYYDGDRVVLDLDCKAHELDNLYVTDASFFPSVGAVNPTLTIIANALRVAERIRERLGA
jgi:choline dehydrogenase-like flavoprotein